MFQILGTIQERSLWKFYHIWGKVPYLVSCAYTELYQRYLRYQLVGQELKQFIFSHTLLYAKTFWAKV